jgi:hypothetical protein
MKKSTVGKLGKETVQQVLFFPTSLSLLIYNEIQTCDTWGRRGKTAEAHINIWRALDLEEEKKKN